MQSARVLALIPFAGMVWATEPMLTFSVDTAVSLVIGYAGAWVMTVMAMGFASMIAIGLTEDY